MHSQKPPDSQDKHKPIDDASLKTCRVCGARVPFLFYDNRACSACRNFFSSEASRNHTCVTGNCVINKETRDKCAHCRLEKCKQVGMGSETLPLEKCLVCGEDTYRLNQRKACGFCNDFFERNSEKLVSRCVQGDDNCVINWKTRNKCARCWLQKCKQLRMVLEPVIIYEKCLVCGDETDLLYQQKACGWCDRLYHGAHEEDYDQRTCIREDGLCDFNGTIKPCRHCTIKKCKNLGMRIDPKKAARVQVCKVCQNISRDIIETYRTCTDCEKLLANNIHRREEFRCDRGRTCRTRFEITHCPSCRIEKCAAVMLSESSAVGAPTLPSTLTPKTCKVCDDQVLVLHFGDRACTTCWNFFHRYSEKPVISCLQNDGNCVISEEAPIKCVRCWLQKCRDVGLTIKAKGVKTVKDVLLAQAGQRMDQCKICGTQTIHLVNQVSCGQCDTVFRDLRKTVVRCPLFGRCLIRSRKDCASCLYDKCLKFGMDEYCDSKELLTRTLNMRKPRSKSADYPRKVERPKFDPSFSVLDLTEIENYAIGKYERLTFKKNKKPNILEPSEILNPSTFSTRLLNSEDLGHWSMMLADGEQQQEESTVDDDTFERLMNRFGLLFVSPRDSGEFRALRDYQKYLKTVEKLLADAKRESSQRLTAISESIPDMDHPTQTLLDVYRTIFNFNIYLIEHLLHLIARHGFTPFHITLFEQSNDDRTVFQKQLEQLLLAIPTIIDAYFNVEPLKRMLEEMKELRLAVSAEEFKCQVYLLGLLAMQNIRVPQSADKLFNEYDWMNRGAFNETFDLLRFYSMDDPGPQFERFLEDFEEHGYSAEDVRAQCLSFLHTSPTATLLAGILKKFDNFCEQLLNGKRIDRRVKVFYRSLVIRRILNAVKSGKLQYSFGRLSMMDRTMLTAAVISNYKYRNPCQEYGRLLNEKYEELREFPNLILRISPSYMGVSFATFKEELFISVVKNCNKTFAPFELDDDPAKEETEVMDFVCGKGRVAKVLLDPESRHLYVKVIADNEVENADKIRWGTLESESNDHGEYENEIKLLYNKEFNKMRWALDDRMMEHEHPTVIGRVENPKDFI